MRLKINTRPSIAHAILDTSEHTSVAEMESSLRTAQASDVPAYAVPKASTPAYRIHSFESANSRSINPLA